MGLSPRSWYAAQRFQHCMNVPCRVLVCTNHQEHSTQQEPMQKAALRSASKHNHKALYLSSIARFLASAVVLATTHGAVDL